MGHHHHHGCGHQDKLHYTRRELLGRLGGGIAGLAFADLLSQNGLGAVSVEPATALEQARNPLAPKLAPLPAKAKAVRRSPRQNRGHSRAGGGDTTRSGEAAAEGRHTRRHGDAPRADLGHRETQGIRV